MQLRTNARKRISCWRSSAVAIGLLTVATATQAVNITAPMGSTSGGTSAQFTYSFIGGDDGNVWVNTNEGAPLHWENLVPLNVSFGAGVTAPGGNPAAYAVATDGNLYIIHIVGSSWATQNLGTPSGVALVAANGTFSNTSNQPFVFLIGSDGNLWLAHNAGSWTWTNVGKPPTAGIAAPFTSMNVTPSYPQSFVLGTDGAIWQASWNGSGYTWKTAGHPASASIVRGLTACGATAPTIHVLGSDSNLWTATVSGSSWSGWSSSSPTGPGWGPGGGGFAAGNPPASACADLNLFNVGGNILFRFVAFTGWTSISLAGFSEKIPNGLVLANGVIITYYIDYNGNLVAYYQSSGPANLGHP